MTASSKRRRTAPAAPQPPAPPPLLRDIWALAPLVAAIALAMKSWFTHIGEPVADDFDFIHHTMFSGPGAWLDGGGSRFYWRPLARQLYFALFGGVALAHPAWVVVLQTGLLGLAGLLLYLTLRRFWPRPWCAAAATFPLLLEASRSLIATATNFQDLGLLLFSALALYLMSRGRRVAALAALLAALLCKEMAVVTAAALPLVMPATPGGARTRLRWAAASAAVVIVWAAVYWQVMSQADLLLARDAGQKAEALATPWLAKFGWACRQSLLDASGLAVLTPTMQRGMTIAWAAIAVVALAVILRDAAARGRLRAQAAWAWGGLTAFALATATLADVFPDWRPYRSTFGVMGLGIAGVALLAPLRTWLLAAFVAVHVAAFALCPPPPAVVAPDFGGAAFLDFARLVGFQRMVGETRRELALVLPHPAHGARVARHYYPQGTLHAFAGDRSLQTWYRDTTLGFAGVEAAVEGENREAVTVLQYQPTPPRQVVPVHPLALWHLDQGAQRLSQNDWAGALSELARADSIQADKDARLFTSLVAGKRALALVGAGQYNASDSAAVLSLTLWNGNDDGRHALVTAALSRGDFRLAEAYLEPMVRARPRDARLRKLLEVTRQALAGTGPH